MRMQDRTRGGFHDFVALVFERPHPACWMVKKVGQLATRTTDLDPIQLAWMVNQVAQLGHGGDLARQPASPSTKVDGVVSRCRSPFSYSTLFTIRQAGWGLKNVCNDEVLRGWSI